MNFQMFTLVLEKAEEPVIKLPKSAESSKNKRVPEKYLFCFIDYAKDFDCAENSKEDGNTRPPDLPLKKPVCRSGSNS